MGSDAMRIIRCVWLKKTRALVRAPERLLLRGRGVGIARKYFDYAALAHSLRGVIERALGERSV